MTRRRSFGAVTLEVGLLGLGAVVAAPVALVLLNAFKSPTEFVGSTPWSIPAAWTLQNFSEVLGAGGLYVAMARSLLVIVFLLITQLPLSLLAAYAFALGEFRGRRALYAATVASLAIPVVALVLPLYLLAAAAGIRETFWGLVIPWSLGSAFAVVLLREHFGSIPREQIDAARLDGAREIQVLTRIAIPQSLPVLAVVAIVTVVTHWNAYLWPQIIAGTRWPVAAVATAALQGQYATRWTVILAGCAVMIMPVLVLFARIQRSWSMLVVSPEGGATL